MPNNKFVFLFVLFATCLIVEGASFILNKTLFFQQNNKPNFEKIKNNINLYKEDELLNSSSSQLRQEIINLKFHELSSHEIKKDFEKYSSDTFSYSPYREFISNEYSSKHLNVNKYGFRGDEFTLKKNTDFRILMFGSSAVFGWPNSSDDETISSYLENNLNKNKNNKKISFEVINLSVKSYNVMQGFISYLILSQFLDYDMIIIYNGHNDFTDGYFGNGPQYSKINEKDGTYKDYDQAIREKNYNLFFKQGFFYLKNNIKYSSLKVVKKIFSNSFELIKNIKSKDHLKNIKSNDYVISNNNLNKNHGYNSINTKISYTKILDKWFKTINNSNKKIIYIHQPNLYATNKQKSFWENLWTNFGRNKNFYLNFETEKYKKKYIDQVKYANKLAAENNVKYIDIDSKISNLDVNVNIFFDHVHLTKEGNEFVASEIAKEVIKIVN